MGLYKDDDGYEKSSPYYEENWVDQRHLAVLLQAFIDAPILFLEAIISPKLEILHIEDEYEDKREGRYQAKKDETQIVNKVKLLGPWAKDLAISIGRCETDVDVEDDSNV